jgi:hypothetical protein
LLPFEIEFFSSHALETEYVKMGDVYLKRYAYEELDNDFEAEFGALRLNIFKRTKVDTSRLQNAFMSDLKKLVMGDSDYTVPFARGLKEGDAGDLSNRAIEYDRTTYPAKITFVGEKLSPLFSEVVLLENEKSAETDYILKGEVLVDNEIRQYKSAAGRMMFGEDHVLAANDYYVYAKARLVFSLVERKTGKVIVTEKTKFEYPIGLSYEMKKYLPLSDASKYYELDEFEKLNYDEYAADVMKGIVSKITPYVSSFVVNYVHAEKVEK